MKTFLPQPIKPSSWRLASVCLWSCESVLCCETTVKWGYEILLLFRFTAWVCFQFVRISKLLARVTQNLKYRAVFLVMLPVNTRPEYALLDSQTDTEELLLSVRSECLGQPSVSSAVTCISICFMVVQISVVTTVSNLPTARFILEQAGGTWHE